MPSKYVWNEKDLLGAGGFGAVYKVCEIFFSLSFTNPVWNQLLILFSDFPGQWNQNQHSSSNQGLHTQQTEIFRERSEKRNFERNSNNEKTQTWEHYPVFGLR